MIILIFGDSITQGYWDEGGGWADRVKAAVFAKDIANDLSTYHGVHNLGIDGNTAQRVLERFDSEVNARLQPNSDYAVIFAVGVNDTVTKNGNDGETTSSKYAEHLEALCEKASIVTSNIAFLNLSPVDESLTNPLPTSSTGKCYTNERIDSYNIEITRACEKFDCELINIADEFSKINDSKLLADGLHPNTAGHEVIYNAVMPIINNWLY
jgi:lysophospholipase L1-like esterase